MEEKLNILLPDKFIKQLINTPESGMGYHKAVLYMRSGQVFQNVVIKNCSILTLENSSKLNIEDIERIVVIDV